MPCSKDEDFKLGHYPEEAYRYVLGRCSGGVIGVDGDVLGGEVAGEEAGGSGALAEVKRNGEFALQHGGVGGGLVKTG